MQLLYLMPGSVRKGPLGEKEVQRRQAVLGKYTAPGVNAIVRDLEDGPASIESAYEEYLSIPGSLREIVRTEAEGLDGVIIGCFGDPGVDAARELVKIPVIGPAEASMHLAAMLGHKFSVITVLKNVVPLIEKIALLSGLRSRMASIRTIDTPVLSLAESREQTVRKLMEAGRDALEKDGADSLILGCMSMAFLEVHVDLEQRLEIPVVNPAVAALKTLESMVGMRIAHSKKAYPTPVKKTLLSVA